MTTINSAAPKNQTRPLAVLLLLMAFLSVPLAASAKGHLYSQPWLKPTTGDLRLDLATARLQGKRLTLIWEQAGCVYCKKMHEINFKQKNIVDLITGKFYPVQLDLRGDRELIDFDGEQLNEAAVARKHGVNGTPTTEFRDDRAIEVFRMPGYAEPLIYRGILEYVASGDYTEQKLVPWLKANFFNRIDQPGDS